MAPYQAVPVRIVSPYKPLPISALPQVYHGMGTAGFDWLEALRMLQHSAECFGYPVFALTDAELPFPSIKVLPQETDLMLWILEASLLYLSGPEFVEDTAMISPDSLINAPLPAFENFDLGIPVRFDEKHRDRPVLNSIQLWPVAAKDRLVRFYAECLFLARMLAAERADTWGLDTIPIETLLLPFEPGINHRAGLDVMMFHHKRLMRTLSARDIFALDNGVRPLPVTAAVIDFKGRKKNYMRAYFEATL